jgi:AhpD family alkylhydroperoxidase
MSAQNQVYPEATRELADQRKRLAPGPAKAFRAFSQSVFAEGAVPARTKQLIAVAVAHVTQCPYCIRGHTSAALQQGVRAEEIMEAIWVAAEMRAGGAYAHSALALDTIARFQSGPSGRSSSGSTPVPRAENEHPDGHASGAIATPTATKPS